MNGFVENKTWLHPIQLYANELRDRIDHTSNPVLSLPSNILLAPLAGASDLPFRHLCQTYGAGLTCTELVSARGLHYAGVAKSWRYLRLGEDETPRAIQLFGYDPTDFAAAIELILKTAELPRPDIIDINMGCPVPKVTKTGAGSALMLRPELAAKIISACKNTLNGTDILVTCKFRRGYNKDSNIAAEFALAMAEAGAAMITVHGRTREQGYSGTADWECIAEVVEAVHGFLARHRYSPIPVIANGDIIDGPTARKALETTGADGVMIGRAALGHPWIFREITNYLQGLPKPEAPTRQEIAAAIWGQYQAYLSFYDETTATKELRKIIGWYLRGQPGAVEMRRLAVSVSNRDDVLALLRMWSGFLPH